METKVKAINISSAIDKISEVIKEAMISKALNKEYKDIHIWATIDEECYINITSDKEEIKGKKSMLIETIKGSLISGLRRRVQSRISYIDIRNAFHLNNNNDLDMFKWSMSAGRLFAKYNIMLTIENLYDLSNNELNKVKKHMIEEASNDEHFGWVIKSMMSGTFQENIHAYYGTYNEYYEAQKEVNDSIDKDLIWESVYECEMDRFNQFITNE